MFSLLTRTKFVSPSNGARGLWHWKVDHRVENAVHILKSPRGFQNFSLSSNQYRNELPSAILTPVSRLLPDLHLNLIILDPLHSSPCGSNTVSSKDGERTSFRSEGVFICSPPCCNSCDHFVRWAKQEGAFIITPSTTSHEPREKWNPGIHHSCPNKLFQLFFYVTWTWTNTGGANSYNFQIGVCCKRS